MNFRSVSHFEEKIPYPYDRFTICYLYDPSICIEIEPIGPTE